MLPQTTTASPPVPADQPGTAICRCWLTGDPYSWLLPDVILHLSSHRIWQLKSLGSIGGRKSSYCFVRGSKKWSFVSSHCSLYSLQ